MSDNRGKFIVIEGIDGAGKTLQIARLAERLRREGIEFHQTREPTKGPIGLLIRNEYLSGMSKADQRVIELLFAADRLDHLTNPDWGLLSILEKGIHVITDRYYHSSIAYQGALISMDSALTANRINMETLRPTCTIFIDITPEESVKRRRIANSQLEIFENFETQTKVYDCYKKLMRLLRQEGEEFYIVDGSPDPNLVEEIIWDKVKELLG